MESRVLDGFERRRLAFFGISRSSLFLREGGYHLVPAPGLNHTAAD